MVMPGFTHLQSAQPVTFGHHLMAYVEMLARDRSRFRDARARLNECPLGAAALAGTSFPIDRDATAQALGFDRPTANSLDSVADRDFVLEALAAASICAVHLSRFAEEIVLWTTPQFGFVRLCDAFSTGSSIMPQKRNPDAAELVRGKTGRVTGSLVGLLTVMKGLPLAYSKDMQEDKEGAMDGLRTLSLCLAAMTGMVRDLTPDAARMKAAAGAGYATATDLADWLVRTLKMPFREAHHVTGRIVGLASARGVALEALSLDEMQGGRAAHHGGGLAGAGGGELGAEPDFLRRDGAGQCARAGGGVAGAAQVRLAAALVCAALTLPAQAQTQRDLNAAEGTKFEAADKAMNAVYGQLTAKISPGGQKALRDAQRLWMSFRDKECDFETLGTAAGSIHPMEVAICLARLTRARTADLKAQLDCEEGDLTCGGQ